MLGRARDGWVRVRRVRRVSRVWNMMVFVDSAEMV
jgi:hypothetical protein